MTTQVLAPGSLIAARGREWVVLPASTPEFVVARPLNGDMELVTGLFPGEITEASFPRPSAEPGEVGDDISADLLRTALRIGFTSSAGPLRSLASIAVEPRQYQLVPLLLALRMDVVRLLIGDDVGIGKTVEAALIAKELLEQGEAARLTVLCSPALAEQWQDELRDKFAIDATLVLPSTVTRLERGAGYESIFTRHPCTVVSTDFIKSDRHRAQFLLTCPDLVIVDEAHTCVAAGVGRRQRQQRYELLQRLAADARRHLILVTATPHSGKEDAFRDLIGLLHPDLSHLDLENPKGRERLAQYFVQRRRRDIRSYLNEETAFPRDRQIREVPYCLAGGYAALSKKILAYARETVAEASTGDVRQRVRWWSALALLRSVASSPAAAAATLRARSVTAAAETPEEADELGRSTVLDLVDDDALEGLDTAPGADDEQLPAASRTRLLTLAREAEKLAGTTSDAKLGVLITEVKALLADGYDPIVFCRFIPTAEYVAEHLGAALGRKAHVAAVTGTLPPAERRARIDDLTTEPGRHVLVATDCLSEGVNLQEHFQAVVHYDLAWNPTRHEQREGRVDRFGQRRTYVRAVTLYGQDNGIDGVVLDVLIRKHQMIARQTGVAVPVPDRSDGVIQALVEGLLLRNEAPDQLELDLDLGSVRDGLHRDWESAADRESKALTKYAQSGVKLDEVRQVADAARAAIGGPADVARFVRESLSALGGSVHAAKDHFTVQPQALPVGARHALGLASSAGSDLVFRPDLPVPPGDHPLVRTDPLVAALGRYVVDAALDPLLPERERPAWWGGVVRTATVQARTTLLLARYRFHLTLPGRAEPRTVVAEDAQVVAYRAAPGGGRDWLADGEVAALLGAAPDANVLPELVASSISRGIAELDQVQADLDSRGDRLATALFEAHRSVRTAVGAARRGLKVTRSGPADVLGVYIYLPAGGSR
jgi:superfamily II DNA or RNA helicase